MKTKEYKKLLDESLAAGEIPQLLYDETTARIKEKGKMTPAIYSGYVKSLEESGLFDVFTTPFDRHAASVDGSYDYIPKNIFFRIFSKIVTFIFIFFGGILGQIVYGVRVRGRKNLRMCKKGAVTVSNHISYLDALLTRRMAGWRGLKITVAPHNVKTGFAYWMLKAAGVIPIGTTLSGAKAFESALKTETAKGKLIHFYPERSMWLDYDKPRPLKTGAFLYAAKLNVPVVPVYYVYRKKSLLRRITRLHAPITIVISEPIYPEAGNPREQAVRLKHKAEERYAALYAKYKGIRLKYRNGKTLPYEGGRSLF